MSLCLYVHLKIWIFVFMYVRKYENVFICIYVKKINCMYVNMKICKYVYVRFFIFKCKLFGYTYAQVVAPMSSFGLSTLHVEFWDVAKRPNAKQTYEFVRILEFDIKCRFYTTCMLPSGILWRVSSKRIGPFPMILQLRLQAVPVCKPGKEQKHPKNKQFDCAHQRMYSCIFQTPHDNTCTRYQVQCTKCFPHFFQVIFVAQHTHAAMLWVTQSSRWGV